MEEDSNQRGASLDQLDEFPPTVVDHTEYDDGVDLHFLDPGTQEEPRFARIYNDGREMEVYR